MIIKNAKVFINGEFVDKVVDFSDTIDDIYNSNSDCDFHRNTDGSADFIDAKGCYLIPGLIDVHTHGAMNADASDGDLQGIETMSKYYAAEGVTSWCPTTMTLQEETLKKAVTSVADYKRPTNGAKILGIHMEGPFISEKKLGAQNKHNLALPDVDMFHRLQETSGGLIKIITMAPELPGAMEFIKEISKECVVSIGHTDADYDTAIEAFKVGASHATHLFNAMPPLGQRAPGVVGAAFDSVFKLNGGTYVELIIDGIHIHPNVIRMVHRLFGDRLVLISDSLRCAGMPDGDYELGGQMITMKDGKALVSGTNTIAGSSIHLMEGLRRTVSYGIPLEDAVISATLSPAKSIGVDDLVGSIDIGKAADLVILDENLNVKEVFIDGKALHQHIIRAYNSRLTSS